MTTTSIFASVASLLIACGGSTGLSSDPGQLIGNWRELPASFQSDKPINQRVLATYGADGSFTIDPRGGAAVVSGTYAADDRTLTSTQANDALAEPYLVTADRLMLGPLAPVGSVDEVVGTWHLELDERMGQTTFVDIHDLTLHGDGTAHEVEHAPDGNIRTTDGTWTASVDEVVIEANVDGIALHLHLQRMPGFDALGGLLLEKLD